MNYTPSAILSRIVLAALALGFLSACVRVPPDNAIDPDKAREIADSLANILIKERVNSDKLEKAFRESLSERDLDLVVEQMVQAYGRPMEFQFKHEDFGSKVYDDGTQKPMRKFWYAAKTTKHEKGTHFLIVEVVPDGDQLAVSSFAIVNFPLGIPEALK